MEPQVLVIEGSRTDDERTKVFIDMLGDCGVRYVVDCNSAHWNAGEEYIEYIDSIKVKIVVFLGGMSLVAPGIISANLRNLGKHDIQVISIPTDKAALSATQDLPEGTPVLTPGLNTISATHSIKNGALGVAKLALAIYNDPKIAEGLEKYYNGMKEKKRTQRNIGVQIIMGKK